MFDPRELITDEQALRDLFLDYAERRVRFTRAWLERSPLDAMLHAIGTQTGSSWRDTGLPAEALGRLRAQGFDEAQLHLAFAHPATVSRHPELIGYYQRLLSMSGKVFTRVFPRLERLRRRNVLVLALADDERSELETLNEMLVTVAAAPGFDPETPVRLVVASEGAAIDGDWRNQTGRIATWRAMEAMIGCLDRPEIVHVTAVRGDETIDLTASDPSDRSALVDRGWRPGMLETSSGYRVRFGPQTVADVVIDADITVARIEDESLAAITAAGEIKGASDPANAKERWRLAAGNIEAMHRIRSGRLQARPTTFYVGLVITEAVVEGDSQITGMREMLDRRTLDSAFSLVTLARATEWRRFRDFFRAQVGW
jgi:hypothetical protein